MAEISKASTPMTTRSGSISRNILAFFSTPKTIDNDSVGDDSLGSGGNGSSVDGADSPIAVTPAQASKQVLKPEERKTITEQTDSDTDLDSIPDEEKANPNDSKNSSNSSQSSTSSNDEFYKLGLDKSVYDQTDSDWPIREALMFRLGQVRD